MLSGNRFYSMKEIMDLLESSERTIYRYLDTFEVSGFILDKHRGNYRLQKDAETTRSLQNLLHFSEEEVLILYETLPLLEGTSAVKEQLIRKLHVLYDHKTLEPFYEKDDLTKIQKLSAAIRNKTQVYLRSYRSSNSHTITDRKVEPFQYLPDYRAVWCYEYESNSCKQFKLARIHEVEPINLTWQMETSHKVHFTDAFRISSETSKDNIKVRLSLKAWNLLSEEFPLSRNHVREEKGTNLLEIPVAGYQGIGRFVMGLPGEVEVVGSEGFKEFLRGERKKFYD